MTMTTPSHPHDAKLDLVFERVIAVPPTAVWKAWTQPEILKQWFCLKPWNTTECTIDLRPGGAFDTVMQGPAGERHAGKGCYLEVVENKKLVWTSALQAGYRPNPPLVGDGPGFVFTATLLLEAVGEGTRYTAQVAHADEAGREAHAAMGFEQGWGTALDQLVAMVKGW